MPIADTHIHSMFSPDADRTEHNSIEAICKAAISKGIRYITITDHYDVDDVEGINSDINGIETAILVAREQFAKENLHLFFGLELAHANQYPEEEKKIREGHSFDFLFGSLHKITEKKDFFTMKYDQISDAELKSMFENYLAELLTLANFFDFDSLAHCAYPLRYFVKHKRETVIRLPDYYDAYAEIFKALIANGKSLELNTSGLRQEFGMPFPPYSLIKLYFDLGGTLLTVGSDSHAAATLGVGIDEVFEKIKQIGFRYITVYENRKPLQIKL